MEEQPKQSFEEFRGWLRGFLEGTDNGLTHGGVERVKDELDRVDPSMSAVAAPATLNPKPVSQPFWQRHPEYPYVAPTPPYFPWPGGVTLGNAPRAN